MYLGKDRSKFIELVPNLQYFSLCKYEKKCLNKLKLFHIYPCLVGVSKLQAQMLVLSGNEKSCNYCFMSDIGLDVDPGIGLYGGRCISCINYLHTSTDQFIPLPWILESWFPRDLFVEISWSQGSDFHFPRRKHVEHDGLMAREKPTHYFHITWVYSRQKSIEKSQQWLNTLVFLQIRIHDNIFSNAAIWDTRLW